eukprot:g71349.t1
MVFGIKVRVVNMELRDERAFTLQLRIFYVYWGILTLVLLHQGAVAHYHARLWQRVLGGTTFAHTRARLNRFMLLLLPIGYLCQVPVIWQEEPMPPLLFLCVYACLSVLLRFLLIDMQAFHSLNLFRRVWTDDKVFLEHVTWGVRRCVRVILLLLSGLGIALVATNATIFMYLIQLLTSSTLLCTLVLAWYLWFKARQVILASPSLAPRTPHPHQTLQACGPWFATQAAGGTVSASLAHLRNFNICLTLVYLGALLATVNAIYHLGVFRELGSSFYVPGVVDSEQIIKWKFQGYLAIVYEYFAMSFVLFIWCGCRVAKGSSKSCVQQISQEHKQQAEAQQTTDQALDDLEEDMEEGNNSPDVHEDYWREPCGDRFQEKSKSSFEQPQWESAVPKKGLWGMLKLRVFGLTQISEEASAHHLARPSYKATPSVPSYQLTSGPSVNLPARHLAECHEVFSTLDQDLDALKRRYSFSWHRNNEQLLLQDPIGGWENLPLGSYDAASVPHTALGARPRTSPSSNASPKRRASWSESTKVPKAPKLTYLKAPQDMSPFSLSPHARSASRRGRSLFLEDDTAPATEDDTPPITPEPEPTSEEDTPQAEDQKEEKEREEAAWGPSTSPGEQAAVFHKAVSRENVPDPRADRKPRETSASAVSESLPASEGFPARLHTKDNPMPTRRARLGAPTPPPFLLEPVNPTEELRDLWRSNGAPPRGKNQAHEPCAGATTSHQRNQAECEEPTGHLSNQEMQPRWWQRRSSQSAARRVHPQPPQPLRARSPSPRPRDRPPRLSISSREHDSLHPTRTMAERAYSSTY